MEEDYSRMDIDIRIFTVFAKLFSITFLEAINTLSRRGEIKYKK